MFINQYKRLQALELNIKSKKTNTWITSIIGISLVALTMLIFKDNTIFDNYVRNIFPYIISGIILNIITNKKPKRNAKTATSITVIIITNPNLR